MPPVGLIIMISLPWNSLRLEIARNMENRAPGETKIFSNDVLTWNFCEIYFASASLKILTFPLNLHILYTPCHKLREIAASLTIFGGKKSGSPTSIWIYFFPSRSIFFAFKNTARCVCLFED